jgi:putative N-acetyltransferase (TIGR04045 family)
METIVCKQVDGEQDLRRCFAIRHKVFVEEQGLFPVTDRDELDAQAVHIAAFLQNRIIGTVRMYQDDCGDWWGGRLAVLKKYRGRAGRELVLAAMAMVKKCGGKTFYANVLKENIKFFVTLTWQPVGNFFMLHGRPHQLMAANLRLR